MQRRLVAADVLALLCLVGVLITLRTGPAWARVAFGAPLVLVLPGYAWGNAVFPSESLRAAARVMISIGLSLIAVVLGGFILNLAPGGLQPQSWAILLCAVTLAASALMLIQTPAPRERQMIGAVRSVGAQLRIGQVLLLAIAALVATAAIALAVNGAVAAQRRDTFTELWIMQVGASNQEARIGVKNMEGRALRYQIALTADGKPVGQPQSITLQAGQQWEATETLPPAPPSGDRIVVTLERTDRPGRVYRQASLGRT